MMFTAALLTGCSGVDEIVGETEQTTENCTGILEQGEKNIGYMRSLSAGEEAVTFARAETRTFHRSRENGNEWMEQPDLLGNYPQTPSRITICDGNTWEAVDLFRMPRPNPLGYLMEAYRIATGFNKKFMISCRFEYAGNGDSIRISGKDYRLEAMNQDEMVVSRITVFVDGDGEGHSLDWTRYEKEELSLPDKDSILFFESELDAYMYMIELLRGEFGDEFRINEYLAPYMELDDDLVNLDEIRRYILERYGNNCVFPV